MRQFPFTDSTVKKVRPVLVLSSARHFGSKIDFSVMPMIISLKRNQDLWPADIIIENLAAID